MLLLRQWQSVRHFAAGLATENGSPSPLGPLAIIVCNSELCCCSHPAAVSSSLLFVSAGACVAHQPSSNALPGSLEPELPATRATTTRRVNTQVWCAFFVANAVISGYHGFPRAKFGCSATIFIAYLLMGLLFAGEWLIRYRRRNTFV